jgi:hypothetical protein
VIFILLIFILSGKCKKTNKFNSDEEKLTHVTHKNEQVNSSKQNEAVAHSASESDDEEEDDNDDDEERSPTETEKSEDDRKVKKVYSKKEWEMHKKRTKLFEEQEAEKRITNLRSKKPQDNFGFSYANPDELIDAYKTRNSSIPRLKIYKPNSNGNYLLTFNAWIISGYHVHSVKRYATDTLVRFIHAPYINNLKRFDVFFLKSF